MRNSEDGGNLRFGYYPLASNDPSTAFCRLDVVEFASPCTGTRPGRLAAVSELYGPVIYQWCRGAGLQPADASDATQEVFRGVMTGIAQLRHGVPSDSFRGWLWAITRYKIQDHFRFGRRQPGPAGGDQRITSCKKFLTMVEMSRPTLPIRRTMQTSGSGESFNGHWISFGLSFDDYSWQAFWQMTQGDRSAAEIGVELGMTPGQAVRQAKFRVLKRLREELEGLLD